MDYGSLADIERARYQEIYAMLGAQIPEGHPLRPRFEFVRDLPAKTHGSMEKTGGDKTRKMIETMALMAVVATPEAKRAKGAQAFADWMEAQGDHAPPSVAKFL